MRCLCCITLIVFCFGSSLSAAPIMPAFDDFGELPGATFGGSGISNDPVAITTISSDGDTITLGLVAHRRTANPELAHDGAGTFFAPVGSNFGDPTFGTMPSPFLGSTWNVGFFIDVSGGGTFDDYMFELLYDFDPGADTDETVHGILDFNSAIALTIFPTPLASIPPHVEGTENPLFAFFADGGLPFITVPTPGTFDPDAIGEYSFALVASDGSGELGRSAIHVNTTPVPEPTSFALLASGALGFVGYSWRRKRILAA